MAVKGRYEREADVRDCGLCALAHSVNVIFKAGFILTFLSEDLF